MKSIKILIFFLSCISLLSCEDNNTSSPLLDNGNRDQFSNSDVNAFIYHGLDAVYLYKDEQPLFDQDFELNNDITPEDYFETLTVPQDRFSWIVSDFEILENSFAGISLTDGIDSVFFRINEGSEDLIGVVLYVANNSPGQDAGVKRGDFFRTINGIQITSSNRSGLLNQNSLSIELLNRNNATEEFSVTKVVSIEKEEFTENPILINKVINYEGQNIGYILYNSFISGSENELNEVFAEFKAAGINDLVLDLRYNGGGRISTAVDLCGMITGQFNEEIVIQEQWNSELQQVFNSDNPEALFTRFRNTLTNGETPLNSLNLSKLHVISSKNRTASSSELVINGLDAYIDVVHIGSQNGTVGKSQASITVYDSPDLINKNDINTSHKYAMQPLVYTSANKNGTIVPNEGLIPDTFIEEDVTNLGTLGEIDEPLLKKALDAIVGNNSNLAAKNTRKNIFGNYVTSSKESALNYQRMYD